MATLQGIRIQQLQTLLHYNFTSPALAWEALQCSGNAGFPEGCRRLALLGDTVLRLKLILTWLPTGNRTGTAQNSITQTVQNANLSAMGRAAGLDHLIIINPSQSVVQDSQVADCIEAVIGAVYQDGGMQQVVTVMQTLGFP